MAYDERLAGRIRAVLATLPVADVVVEKKAFGGLAFLVAGNMAVSASGQGGMLVRVDPGATEALVRQPGVERMVMRGRAMDGWLRVSADATASEAALLEWVERGAAFATALPPKD